MMLSVTKAVRMITDAKFQKLLLSGAFPKINYSESKIGSGGMCHSYNLFEYSDTHARYMKLIDSLMKENKMDEQLGVFTRQHSNAFLTKLSVLIEPITELDVVCHDERFKSFADAVRGSVS